MMKYMVPVDQQDSVTCNLFDLPELEVVPLTPMGVADFASLWGYGLPHLPVGYRPTAGDYLYRPRKDGGADVVCFREQLPSCSTCGR